MNSTAWSPLRYALFRDRWIASIVSIAGSWMQDTAGAWLMTSLTTSPFLIALMQTAATLPVLLLGIIAGATADIFDRRRLLLFWQGWMLVVALILSILTLMGKISPSMLLTLTFLLSLGGAMGNPAWQAIVPELVPRSELPSAIALNSAGFNLGRAIGPALGGILVAIIGAGMVFLLNSASFLGVIMVLYFWRREPLYKSSLPAERMIGAVRAGLRYVRYAPAMKSVLIRTSLVTFFVSVVWALLPLIAQKYLNVGAAGYGFLNGCLGLGSVVGTVFLPKWRRRFSTDGLVVIATIVYALTAIILAYIHYLPIIILALFAGGVAWISIASSFNIAVQLSVPSWVQARALGIYQMVFMGGLAIGSAFWGFLAQNIDVSAALLWSAIGLLAGIPFSLRYRLKTSAKLDLSPALHWPEPHVTIDLSPEEGPVLVIVEYYINPAKAKAFLKAIYQLGRIRRRDGAFRWGIFRDIDDPSRYVERFVTESWLEHLRQHEHFTIADRVIEDKVRSFHTHDTPPVVDHMIYAREPQG